MAYAVEWPVAASANDSNDKTAQPVSGAAIHPSVHPPKDVSHEGSAEDFADGSANPTGGGTIILGIDPGSTVTGFGAVRVFRGQVQLMSYGVIAPPASRPFNERIAIIAGEVDALLERFQPHVTVVERIFLGKNADSAFKLGHTRGATIASAIRYGSDVVEYATRVVKKGITGNGNATKDQVQLVLFAALGLRVKAKLDASDALALAFYHARNIDVLRSHQQNESLGRKRERSVST